MLAVSTRDNLDSLSLRCKAENQLNRLLVRRADGADDDEATSSQRGCNTAASSSTLVAYTLDCVVELMPPTVEIYINANSDHMHKVGVVFMRSGLSIV